MIQELLATLQEKRKDQINKCDIILTGKSYTVVIELHQSKSERFVDFNDYDLEKALQKAIEYINRNLKFN